jgi:hypothetical protein
LVLLWPLLFLCSIVSLLVGSLLFLVVVRAVCSVCVLIDVGSIARLDARDGSRWSGSSDSEVDRLEL